MHIPPYITKYKRVLIALFIIVCAGATAAFAFSKKQIGSTMVTPQPEAVAQNATDKAIPTPPPDLKLPEASPAPLVAADTKHIGVLLLGYGGAGHDGGFLSDTIILAYIDVVRKKLALIHIPRDVWVDVPVGNSTIPMKINASLAMGTKTGNYPTKDVPADTVVRASYVSKQAVATVTGLPIQYVVGVDFNGFAQAINALKGIDVTVNQTFDDPWYPVRGRELELCGNTPEEVTAMSATMSGFTLEKQFPCRYEQLHFPAGINHMDGDIALKYGRSRHTSSDFARGIRQIAIILAVKDKLFSLHALDKIPQFFQTLAKSVRTDLSIEGITVLSPVLKAIPEMEVVQIGLDTTNTLTNGTAKSGAYILMPKSGDGNW